MDYILCSSLRNVRETPVRLTYDINCQYSRYLHSRILTLPSELQLPADMLSNMEHGVPKWHLTSHGLLCRLLFNINHLPGWMRTDGEGIEKGWASLNSVARSTMDQTQGARADSLDDYLNGWNFRKLEGFGTSYDSLK